MRHKSYLHHFGQVDFGCGSGSLLDSLLNYQTSLEKVVGVDISQKSLIRAAKVRIISIFYSTSLLASFDICSFSLRLDLIICLHFFLQVLHSKLNTNTGIKSAVLYDGSITDFDSRLRGFDIGTCLEVCLPYISFVGASWL